VLYQLQQALQEAAAATAAVRTLDDPAANSTSTSMACCSDLLSRRTWLQTPARRKAGLLLLFINMTHAQDCWSTALLHCMPCRQHM
jgi:hypothetical protein